MRVLAKTLAEGLAKDTLAEARKQSSSVNSNYTCERKLVYDNEKT